MKRAFAPVAAVATARGARAAVAVLTMAATLATAHSASAQAPAPTPPAAAKAAPDATAEAKRLSRKLDEMYRAKSSRGRMSMHVTTPNYERKLEMEMLSRGMDDTLVVIVAPQKERGTATLKRGTEMWNYLPKVAKTIRVPPSMMMGSWMGSDVTNDDLVRASSWERDYTVTFVDGGANERCLAYLPRPDAAVTWKRVVACFDKASELPIRVEYYDEKDRKARSMLYGDVRTLGGRTLPTRWTIEPHLAERKGNKTVMQVLEMEWDVSVSDADFSQAALRRSR